MKLRPDEKELNGDWSLEGPIVEPNEECKRVRYIIENILEKLAESPQWGAWEVLYRDPDDGRLWELTYPQGEMHGGGPVRLAVISQAEAEMKYKFKP